MGINEKQKTNKSLRHPSTSKQKAYLALAAISIIWGTTWVVSKIGVQQIPGLELSGIRQFLAGLIFISFFLYKGEKLPTLIQFRWLAILSIFMFMLANGLSTWSVKYITSGLAALIGALYPLCVVIIEMLFFKKNKNTPLTFAGLIVGISGVTIVFYENAFHAQPDGYGFGITLGFVAMIAWSIGTIYVARNKYKMNPYYAVGWQMVISSFFIYMLAVLTHNTLPISQIPLKAWGAIIYLILFGSILAFLAFLYCVKHLPPAIASLYAYINPLVAMLIGALLLKEKLTLTLLTGAIITIAGVYIVNKSIKEDIAERTGEVLE